MPSDLQRYRVVPVMDLNHPWSPSAEIREDDNGGIVYFSDVQARLEAADARIRKLETQLVDTERRRAAAWDAYNSVNKQP